MTLPHALRSHETLIVAAIMLAALLTVCLYSLYSITKMHDLHFEERD